MASGCSVSHTDTSGQTPVFYSVRAGHVTQLKEQVCAMHQKNPCSVSACAFAV